VPGVQFPSTASPDSVKAMSLDLPFDYLGGPLNGAKAANVTLNFSQAREGAASLDSLRDRRAVAAGLPPRLRALTRPAGHGAPGRCRAPWPKRQ
jgi:hypothetical protein